MWKKLLFAVLTLALLSACQGGTVTPEGNTPEAQPNTTPYPMPGDNSTSNESPYPAPGEGAYPSPLEPVEGEESMTRGEVFIDGIDILTMESMPLQFALAVRGNLPTPCHHLRATLNPPNEANEIVLEVYSLADPEEVCAQVISPFETSIPLGSFPEGTYKVIVNGEPVGEFQAQ